MKKIRWLAFIAIAFMALLLLCCNNGFGSSATVKGDGITVQDTLVITITADENLDIFSKSNSSKQASSRTITAEALALTDSDSQADSIKYYLWGEAQTGQKLNPRVVTVTSTDGVTGTVTLDIDCYNWNLTLATTKGLVAGVGEKASSYDAAIDLIEDEALLIGYANVDMMFTNNIKFTISPKGLTKTGTVSLKIAREGDWEIPEGYIATAYLYDLTNGNKITGTEVDTDGSVLATDQDLSTVIYDSDSSIDTFIPVANITSSTNRTYTANAMQVKPGIYLFQIEFIQPGELRKYVWNDTLIVLPGQETAMIHDTGSDLTDEIIIPNLIGRIPDDVTSFSVDFPKTAEYDPEHDHEPGFYTAHFTWDASNVKTETNFAIEIIELSDEVATADLPATWNATTWESLITNTPANVNQSYTYDYYSDVRNSHLYKTEDDSSLFANKSSLYLYLELGKRYVARLCSENNAGKSANWTYMTLPTGGYKTINQYRVTYHLQQGTWKYQGVETIVDPVEYDGQKTAGYPIIVPNGDGSAGDGIKPSLMANGATWYYWSLGVGGDPYSTNYSTPEAYEGYANLDLYAVYSRKGTIVVQDDNDYDILDTYVSIKAADYTRDTDGSILSTSDYESTPAKGAQETFSLYDHALVDATEGYKYANFVVNLPAADSDETTNDEWKYDKVTFQITYGGRTYVAQEQIGAPRGDADGNVFAVNFSNMPTGYVYNCKFTAHYQRTVISYPFALYLTD